MEKAAKILLLNSKNELLLYLRDDKPSIPHPGFWDLIGGGVEKGETPLMTLKREIKEEIDSEVREVQIIGSEIYEPLNVHITFFKGDIDKNIKKINLTEGQKLDFFRLSNLPLKFPTFYRDFMHQNKPKIFN